MNHHLRFAGPAFITAGVILSLSSCSSTKVEPLLAQAQHEITYEIRLFEVSEGVHQDGLLRVLSAEDGATLIRSLDQEPVLLKTIAGRLGEKKTYSDEKDFVYPTAYDPPKYTKPSDNTTFPVTPSKPRDFVTTKVGTTISLTGSKTQKKDGPLELQIDFDRKVLHGFVNYGTPITADATDWLGRKVPVVITENRIEQPRFLSHRQKTSITLSEDQFLVLGHPGIPAKDQDKFPFSQKRPPGFITMIRATTR